MKCEDVLELISASLDDELTAQQEAQLQAHLDQCGKCRALREELLGLREGCGQLEAAPPPALKEQIMAALPAQDRETAKKRRSRWKSWAAMAAALALIAVAAWRLPQFRGDQQRATDATAAGQSDAAEAGEETDAYAGTSRVNQNVDDFGYVEDDWVDVNAVPRDGGVDTGAAFTSVPYGVAAAPCDLQSGAQEDAASSSAKLAESGSLNGQPSAKRSEPAAGGGMEPWEGQDQESSGLDAKETPMALRALILDPVYSVDDSDTDVVTDIFPADDEPIEDGSPAAEATCAPAEALLEK